MIESGRGHVRAVQGGLRSLADLAASSAVAMRADLDNFETVFVELHETDERRLIVSDHGRTMQWLDLHDGAAGRPAEHHTISPWRLDELAAHHGVELDQVDPDGYPRFRLDASTDAELRHAIAQVGKVVDAVFLEAGGVRQQPDGRP